MYNMDDEDANEMPFGGFTNPYKDLPAEDQQLIEDYNNLMQRLNREERERNKDRQQQRIKDRAQEVLIQLKTLFQDPDFRAMAKEMFLEAKSIREEA